MDQNAVRITHRPLRLFEFTIPQPSGVHCQRAGAAGPRSCPLRLVSCWSAKPTDGDLGEQSLPECSAGNGAVSTLRLKSSAPGAALIVVVCGMRMLPCGLVPWQRLTLFASIALFLTELALTASSTQPETAWSPVLYRKNEDCHEICTLPGIRCLLVSLRQPVLLFKATTWRPA